MNVTVTLPNELGAQVHEAALRQGGNAEAYVIGAVAAALKQSAHNGNFVLKPIDVPAAIAFLPSGEEEDEQEQSRLAEAAREMEYPVSLAYSSTPALRLTGTVRVMGRGRHDFALSEREWQDLPFSEASTDEMEDTADAIDAK